VRFYHQELIAVRLAKTLGFEIKTQQLQSCRWRSFASLVAEKTIQQNEG
jgi:hypothetical protein